MFKEYICTTKDKGLRLDQLCSSLALFSSRNAAVKAIEAGRVFVNSKSTTKKYKISIGDKIKIEKQDTINFSKYEVPLAQDIKINIKYEDDNLLVISKPAGMVTHLSNNDRKDTLVNALVGKYGVDKLFIPDGDYSRAGIVHRLDKDTSGLMIIAKTQKAGKSLQKMLKAHQIDRRYKCLVYGFMEVENGLINTPLIRDPNNRLRRLVGEGPDSRNAQTIFNVLFHLKDKKSNLDFTLLECKLLTGRTHQIRIHMEYIKHPVVGDKLYTKHLTKKQRCFKFQRQFLHSYKLNFIHPLTNKKIQVEDSLPKDLIKILSKLHV